MITPEQKNKLHRLEYALSDIERGVIAVSGGLDSRLLAFVAHRADLDMHCVHLSGPHVPRSETQWAEQWLRKLGLAFTVLSIDPLSHPSVSSNGRDRCYHCKRLLFSAVRDRFPGAALMDGSNATDQQGYRPGLRALEELGIQSPFAESSITKDDIRAMALFIGLDQPVQPATPCLLTRLPYDAPVLARDLERIARLEDECRALGFMDFRVRLVDGHCVLFAHEDNMGRIPPQGLAVNWVTKVSGYWDQQR
ncbi:ATP-dependent sacrificial sulfur transferase LarE [Desulfovibrio ferrophilus]|nr:ATP-dependent sacrificial sulfur transferase LarE [Desulfovibrio ferrophilus]